MFSAILCFSVFVIQENWSLEKPSALLRVEESRARIFTGEVWLGLRTPHERPDDFLTLRLRFANGDIAQELVGYSDGATGVLEDGTPQRNPYNTLANQAGCWEYWLQDPRASLHPRTATNVPLSTDLRGLGLSFASLTSDLSDALWGNNPSTVGRRYRQTLEERRVRVEMLTDEQRTYLWYVDPQRDWNVTEMQLVDQSGVVLRKLIVELQQVNNTWFPRRVLCTVAEQEEFAIEIQSVRLNDPTLPPHLTPDDIGIEPGLNIFVSGQKGPHFWGGDRLLTGAEFKDRLKSGAIRRGPRVEALYEQMRSPQPFSQVSSIQTVSQLRAVVSAEGRQSVWERYTQSVIDRYRFTESQTQIAWRVCRECQGEGNRYLKSKKLGIERIERDMKTAGPQETAKLKEELRNLAGPIQEIFEKKLKPQLRRISTPEQRTTADGPKK